MVLFLLFNNDCSSFYIISGVLRIIVKNSKMGYDFGFLEFFLLFEEIIVVVVFFYSFFFSVWFCVKFNKVWIFLKTYFMVLNKVKVLSVLIKWVRSLLKWFVIFKIVRNVLRMAKCVDLSIMVIDLNVWIIDLIDWNVVRLVFFVCLIKEFVFDWFKGLLNRFMFILYLL